MDYRFYTSENPITSVFTVTFSPEELAVIQERGLEGRLLLDATKHFHSAFEAQIESARAAVLHYQTNVWDEDALKAREKYLKRLILEAQG